MKNILWISMLLASACSAPFSIKTPAGFANVTDVAKADYAYRATTADGVVLAVRTLDRDPPDAEAGFWHQAIENHLRQQAGYAKLSSAAVTSADGTQGMQMLFGHDQNGQPFVYEVGVFLTKNKIILLEAGGRKDRFDAYKDALVSATRSLSLSR